MVILQPGNGDWANTSVGYNPECSLTLKLTGEVGEAGWTEHEIIASFGIGDCSWRATLYAKWWWDPVPPPGQDKFTWMSTLDFSRGGIVIWSDNSDQGTSTTIPESIERTFTASFGGLVQADRATVTPARGIYGQHIDEIDFERRWFIEASIVSAAASLGGVSKTYEAGTAYTIDQWAIGATAVLSYDWIDGESPAYFNDIIIDDHEVPCGGLYENGGDAVGSGNDITVRNQDWSGSIAAPIRVLYHNLPAQILRWADAYPNARIVDRLYCYQNSVAYMLASQIHGYDSGLMWDLSWGDSPSWASTFLADRKVYFMVQAASVQEHGANQDESDTDLVVPIKHFPLNDQDPAMGRVKAMSFSHTGAIEIEGGSIIGFRHTDWAATEGSVGVTVTNGGGSTHFQCAGSGGAKRTLATTYLTDLQTKDDPWNYVWRLEPSDSDQDYCCWITMGSHLYITGYFDWDEDDDRQFLIRVTHWIPADGETHILQDTHNGDSDAARKAAAVVAKQDEVLNYYLTVKREDKGVVKNHILDLDAPSGWTTEPQLYNVATIEFLELVAGDDIFYTAMGIWPDPNNDGDSEQVSCTLPLSPNAEDKFGVAGFVGGHQCFQRVDDQVDQGGVQQGIAHCYPLYGIAGDISQLREVQDLVDVINFLPGWTATKYDIGNALEDSDGNVLVPEAVMFLEWQFNTAAADLYLAPYGRSFTVPYGATYTARPHAIFGGAFNGLAWNNDHTVRKGAGQSVKVVRCSGGSPTATVEATGVTNKNGYWRAAPLPPDPLFAVTKGSDLACHAIINREALWIAAATLPDGVSFLEHIPNVVSLYYAEDGIHHVYTAPPDYYAIYGVNQANYGQPRQDTEGSDICPTGYSDKNGFVRLYFVRGGTVQRGLSPNWGKDWSIVATSIAGTRCSVIGLRVGLQIAVVYDNGTLKCERSHDHFVTVDAETTVATGVDDCQPGVYAEGMILYAAAFKDGVLVVWKSVDLGMTWSEQGVV